eukprot:s549_g13.t1
MVEFSTSTKERQRTLKKELSDRLLGPVASPGRIALEGAPAADFLQSLYGDLLESYSGEDWDIAFALPSGVLLGLVNAWQYFQGGVRFPFLAPPRLRGPIRPFYGVYAYPHPVTHFELLMEWNALDLGTGCGVVALLLATAPGTLAVTASDVSVNAVYGAKEEMKRQGVQVEVIQADLFEGLGGQKFDLVVFNPPWLPLPKPSAGEPPRTKLDSGNFYPEDLFPRLFDGLPEVLNPGGTAVLLFSNHALSRKYVEEHPFQAAMAGSKSKDRFRTRLFTREFDLEGRRRRTGRPQVGVVDEEPRAELWEFQLEEATKGNGGRNRWRGPRALAATGASAAAGIAVLAATGAAVVGARSSDADEPCWASHCGRQDQLSSELVAVLPAQRVELDVSSPLCDSVKVRKVHFNLTKNTVHEITPYSEVYGMHPRLLGIQKGSSTLEPLKDSDEDDESSELADGTILGQWALAKVSKFWPLLGLTAFWFCVLGPATFLAPRARAPKGAPAPFRAPMALFTPPPPKAVPPMPVVAPYVSDADTRKKLWELGMRHHLKALEGVTAVTDQSDPGASMAPVHRARERARDFEIVKKPSAVSPPTVPHHNARSAMLSRDRQLKQKNIQSFDTSWHRKDVSRLQQIPLPKLPPLETKPSRPRKQRLEAEPLPARTPSAGSFRPVRAQLPLPMPKSSSMPALAPLQVEEKSMDKALPKKRSAKKELQTAQAKVPQKVAAFRTADSQAVQNAPWQRQTWRPSSGGDGRHGDPANPAATQAFDVPGYVAGLFLRCIRRAEDFEFHEQVLDSANISQSSFLRSQEMAAAAFLVDEMTNEALEVLSHGEARSLMNDTQTSWPSNGAWWQAGPKKPEFHSRQRLTGQTSDCRVKDTGGRSLQLQSKKFAALQKQQALQAQQEAAEAEQRRQAEAKAQAQQDGENGAKMEAQQKASQRAQNQGDLVSANCYANDAAEYFGENFAHRLRWAHAVNSLRVLRQALRSNAHFVEADVSAGTLTEEKQDPASESPKNAATAETSVATSSKIPIIMAHYPTQRSSDLSFELFVAAVLKHNAQVDGDGLDSLENSTLDAPPLAAPTEAIETPAEAPSPKRSPFSEPVLHQEQEEPLVRSASAIETRQKLPCHEAEAFAGDLHRELAASNHDPMMMACIGARRGINGLRPRSFSKKGVKLDFKVLECVEPALRHLHSVDAAKKLGGHLWLNADVFAGPGYPERFLSPIDARNFVQLCAELVPEAVLSLNHSCSKTGGFANDFPCLMSWGSSSLSATRCYTPDMVNRMIELCMSPIVPRPIRQPSAARPSVVPGEENDIYLTPAASCQHITFAVAAEYALNSSQNLVKLLDAEIASCRLPAGWGGLAYLM